MSESKKVEIREWILKRNSKVSPEDLNDETPLLENRVISSLQIMDLILYLEKISGRKLEMSQLKPGVFKNINTIYASFFEAA